MKQIFEWNKGQPKVAGVYRWRRKGEYVKKMFKGIIMIDSGGYFYDLAIGLLRRFHLEEGTGETEYFPLLSSSQPIVFRDEPTILDMRTKTILKRRHET